MRRVPHPPTLRTLGLALLCLTVVLLVVPSASPLSLVRVGASQRGPTAGSSCANDTGTGIPDCLGFGQSCSIAGVNDPNSPPGEFNEYDDWECSLASTQSNGHPLPAHAWLEAFLDAGGPGFVGAHEHFEAEDGSYVGDYYTLYEDRNEGPGPWTSNGTTPQVYTGPQLVAPTYDPFWTGNGTTHSVKTWTVVEPSGSYEWYFTLRDDLLVKMVSLLSKPCHESATALLSKGCTVPGSIYVAPGWDGGGVDFWDFYGSS